MPDLADLYRRHFAPPRRERAFLSAVGFTTAFAIARGITHAIRADVGPFKNISAGGRHIHHSTFGILGLLAIGYFWTYQWGVGMNPHHRWPSRVTAALRWMFCLCSGLTCASVLTLWTFTSCARSPTSSRRPTTFPTTAGRSRNE